MNKVSLELSEREFKLILKALSDREETLQDASIDEDELEDVFRLNPDTSMEDEIALCASELKELEQVKETIESAGIAAFGEDAIDISEDFV